MKRDFGRTHAVDSISILCLSILTIVLLMCPVYGSYQLRRRVRLILRAPHVRLEAGPMSTRSAVSTLPNHGSLVPVSSVQVAEWVEDEFLVQRQRAYSLELPSTLETEALVQPNLRRRIPTTATETLSVYQPGSDLIKYLQQHPKPKHIIPGCKPGEVHRKPEQTRWICSLCIGEKQIKTRTNDLRGHLENYHGCRRQDLSRIFNTKDPARLWDYFGPCTEEQALQNGWSVRRFVWGTPWR